MSRIDYVWFGSLVLCLMLSLNCVAQPIVRQEAHSKIDISSQLAPGIVVEAVRNDSAGEKAGVCAGDILLSWKRDGAEGGIESPFDLFFLEVDQAPRTPVTLMGLRGEEKSSWQLGPGAWGMEARPNFTGDLLAAYRNGQQLASAGRIVEATAQWKAEGADIQTPSSMRSWLSAWFYAHAADVLAGAQKWQEAEVAYQEAIQRASGASPEIVSQLLDSWALIYRKRDDWNTAAKFYLRIVENERQAGREDNLLVARALNNIGYAAGFSDLNKAEKYYGEALDIRRKIAPQSQALAASLENLGSVLANLGDDATAEQLEIEAVQLREKIAPGSLDSARAFNNLGNIALDIGKIDRAEQYYYQAFAITTKAKMSPLSPFAATLNNGLGLVAFARGDLDKAEEHFTVALTIAQKSDTGSVNVARYLNNLGMVAEHQKELVKAAEYYRESLAIENRVAPESLDVAETLTNLGIVNRELGDRPHAEEYLLRALEITTKLAPKGHGAGAILESLGDVEKDNGDLAKAEEHYRQALAILEKIEPGSQVDGEALARLADAIRQKGQMEASADFYQRALDAFESQTAQLGGSEDVRSNFRARHEGYYKAYIDLLMTQRRIASAFHVMERSRARTLLEMLAVNHVDVHKGVDPALLTQERSLTDLLEGKINRRVRLLSNQHNDQQVQTLDSEIAGLRRQQEDLEARIRARSPGYAALTLPQPLDAKAVQALLSNDTLLLEYSLGEARSYVFAVTANSLNSYELPPRAEIDSKAARLYRLLAEPGRIVPSENERQRRARLMKAGAESRSAAIELSRMVLGGVSGLLKQRRLLIVSDGALQYIPFAALPIPQGPPEKTPPPLVLQHEIVNLPSASVLAFLKGSHAAKKEIVVLADPVFDKADPRVKLAAAGAKQDGQESKLLTEPGPGLTRVMTRSLIDMNSGQQGDLHLSRLLFTRDEAKAILEAAPPESGMQALGFDASRKLATGGALAQYRVVHFATHALVDNIHPELSGLVLSLVDQQGEPVDGFLGLQDIYNMELSADLVVLSACQTALGRQISGEGMIGLTRGFMYAGASGVIATLWNVNDFATAKLMARFYKAMERDRMTPAQALRQAQLSLWKEPASSAPYYWAGFILQGGWQ